MFRQFKRDGATNKLSDEVEPNTLTWTSRDGANVAPGEAEAFDDEPEDDLEGEAEQDDPEATARRAAELQAELQRQAEEFGLTGWNTSEMYGPNGEAVTSLLDSLPTIDYDTAEALADAYEAIPEAERKVAQAVVRRRYRGGELDAELRAAEQAVSDWHASLMLTNDDEALYGIVADAATDAVDALVLEDDLDDVDVATLYGAWSEVMDAESEADDEAEEDSSGADQTGEPAGDAAEEEGEFGPNTALVVEFLTKLAALDTAQTAEVIAAWREQPKEELKAAHRALQTLADEDGKWREQLRLAQEEVFAWMDHRTTRFLDHYSAGSDARGRESAGPAVADAIAALVMADIFEPEDAETLYAPWAEVVGQPALPTYEDDGTA